jgi:N-acetylmuramoyl-L-alanine amidase
VYQVSDHRLFFNGNPVPLLQTQNQGGFITPRWLIIHYTATAQTATQVAYYFQRAEPRVSAHLVVDFDGSVVQCVPFNRAAFHAGRSEWDGVFGLDDYSIGIEVCNPGHLTPIGNGLYRSWFGRIYTKADGVFEATHKFGQPHAGWLPFTPAQNVALRSIGSVLKHAYGLQDVVGHDDISPGRKFDPGPCCLPEVFDYIRSS